MNSFQTGFNSMTGFLGWFAGLLLPVLMIAAVIAFALFITWLVFDKIIYRN